MLKNISAALRVRGREIQSERFFVITLFALNAVVFVLIAAMVRNWTTGDSSRYVDLARNLIRGQFGVIAQNGFEPEGIRSAAYPVFILICDILPGNIELNVVIVQGVLYFCSVFLIWKLIRQTFGNKFSNCFLVFLLFYPFIAHSSCFVSPETACVFLLALSAYILDSALRKGRDYVGFAATGVALGLAIYFRSNLLPLPFFLGLIFLAAYKKNRKAALLLPAAAVLMMVPQMIFNYHNFRSLSPAPVYTGAQTSLWMATWHARVSTDALMKYRRMETTPELAASGMLEQMAEINRKIGLRDDYFPVNLGYYENNAIRERVIEEYGKSAAENIRETPGIYLGSSFVNVFRMWFSAYLSYADIPALLQYYLLFAGFSVFLVGLAGMFLVIKDSVYRASPFVLIAAGSILFHAITLCWSHTEARYTIPARLFLVAFAAYAVSSPTNFSLLNTLKRKLFSDQKRT